MPNYEKLLNFLNSQSKSEITLNFVQIEQIIDEKLPDSAYKHNAWWSNHESHPLMKVILAKNWKSRKLDLNLKEIEFYKISESETDFEKIKQFCVKEFPKSERNYREITIKTLLESVDFTAEQKKFV